jgi:hypothetical protein
MSVYAHVCCIGMCVRVYVHMQAFVHISLKGDSLTVVFVHREASAIWANKIQLHVLVV